jgi:hypothetical protein
VEKMNKQQNDYLDYLEQLETAKNKLHDEIVAAKRDIAVDLNVARQDENVAHWKEVRDEVSKKDLQFIDVNVKRNSVKPGVKVPNNRKKAPSNKKAIAIGACVLLVAGGSLIPKAVEVVERNYTINKEVEDFNEKYVEPNTTYSVVTDEKTSDDKVVHWHDYADVFMQAKYTTNDPVVAFYLAYDSMGEACLNQGLTAFNRLYNTDYQSVSDFLTKNNFADIKEWKIYVANKLAEQKEDTYGSSNIRG